MRLIPLSQGLFAKVDDADYDAVMQFKWYARKNGRGIYAARRIVKANGKTAVQYMHQFLIPGVPRVDHRDGNGLNNQRYNLRPATHQQNMQGFRQPKTGTTSKFRGVCWHKQHGKWQAQIKVDGRTKFLGHFTIEEDAARARDKATLKYYGPDAHFNFPI